MDTFVDTDGFVRLESNPGALVNTNKSALEGYKLQKKKFAEFNKQKEEINTIKEELSEIKQLLVKLLESKE